VHQHAFAANIDRLRRTLHNRVRQRRPHRLERRTFSSSGASNTLASASTAARIAVPSASNATFDSAACTNAPKRMPWGRLDRSTKSPARATAAAARRSRHAP